MSASSRAGAKKKAPEPDSAAAAAAAHGEARSRRRRRARQRGYGDEFMDMNDDVDPDWGGPPDAQSMASDRGAGNLGFASTARSETAAAAGRTTLVGDEFGGGPSMPMVPETWDREGGEGPRHSDG
jgi:PPE-repeat protein